MQAEGRARSLVPALLEFVTGAAAKKDGSAAEPARYGVDDQPPFAVSVLSASQHIGLMAIYLAYPLAVCRAAGASEATTLSVLALSMWVMALGTVLQALPRGPLGSGYLCPPVFSAVYLGPSMLAAKLGGLSLVFGMTLFAGLVEAIISRGLRWLRPLFPTEIAGFVVMMIGFTTGFLGVGQLIGRVGDEPMQSADGLIALVSLGAAVAITVWWRGRVHLFGPLIGMALGYAFAIGLGRFSARDLALITDTPLLALPRFEHLDWKFDAALAVPFAVGALAASFKAMGNIITCEKVDAPAAEPPDMGAVGRGLLADAGATMMAGISGTTGVNTSTPNVGLATATGVTSRKVAYVMGAALVVLAASPKLAALLVIMPRPVMGALLLFTGSFVFVNGLRIMTSRELDSRRTLTIGLATMLGMSAEVYGGRLVGASAELQGILGSGLVLGTSCAFVLNLVFRLGARARRSARCEFTDPEGARGWLIEQGQAWNLSRRTLERAEAALAVIFAHIAQGPAAQAPLAVVMAEHDCYLSLRVGLDGPPPALPGDLPRPGAASPARAGIARGHHHYADRVRVFQRRGRYEVLMRFEV